MDTDVAPVTFQVSVVDSPLLIVEAAALNELITGSGDVVPAGVVSLPDDRKKVPFDAIPIPPTASRTTMSAIITMIGVDNAFF
jgi:hypothetical protein